ncbi:MAG: hypothetical protein DDT41_01456 [candidate division WS2 bacterium]|nr:hypothetical protein [Candidatus Psychracetigena formicireducens]
MARVGTRRHDMELLYNMRLFNPSLKSIKEGRATLNRGTILELEKFTAMTATEKNYLSQGGYSQGTKAVTPFIRRATTEDEKATLKVVQRMNQIKSIFGKDFFPVNVYINVNKYLNKLNYTNKNYTAVWGY